MTHVLMLQSFMTYVIILYSFKTKFGILLERIEHSFPQPQTNTSTSNILCHHINITIYFISYDYLIM